MTSVKNGNAEDVLEQFAEDSFSGWFLEFLEGKGFSTLVVQLEDEKGRNYFHVEDIADFLSFCSEEIQQKAKRQLLELDSRNGNVYQFLECIARGIANISQQKDLRRWNKRMSEREKMVEYQKTIEQNQVFADHVRSHDLADDEIREMKLNADEFLIKILSSKTLYDKLREEIYAHLRNL